MVIALLFTFVVPQVAAAQVPTGTLPTINLTNVPVTGAFNGVPAPAGSVFNGSLTITRFARTAGGQLVAFGRVTGAVTAVVNGVTTTVASFTNQLVGPLPISAISATCTILHLDLAPLDLNLLGLMVHLDRVVLDVTANAAGGLLGQLLSGLLCANNVSQVLVNVLNRVLARL
jgi:hypothetical protein